MNQSKGSPFEVLLSQMLKCRLLLIVILHTCFVVSCENLDVSSLSSQDIPENENILRYDVSVPLTSLDPTEGVAYGSTFIHPFLYSYLFVPNAKGALEPDLASKWFYDSEDFVYTIYLREDALFHDNKPVTPRDVKYSLEQCLGNGHPNVYGSIDRIYLVSDTAISIHLEEDDPRFLYKVWDTCIVPEPHDGAPDSHDPPVGSGPFRFVHRIGEKEVVLEANEDYFRGRPSLDQVVFYFQPDKEKTWTRLLSGNTDIVHEISPKNYEMMKHHEERFYFHVYPLEWYSILLYNTKHVLFSDPRVRRALSHAIDREYIVEKILRGFGVVAVGAMGINSPFHKPELTPVLYQPKKGLRLLEEAGWSRSETGRYLVKDGESFEFTILVFQESQIEKKVARHIRLCLNEVGIRVHLQCLPFSELTRRYIGNDEFEVALTEFGGAYRDFECMKSLWRPDGSQKAAAGSFENPELSRRVGQALDETDPARQEQLFHEIDAMIVSLQPGTFLFHKTAIDVMSKRFKVASPFSLTQAGVWRLIKDATLDED
ncbi:MAG: ABC transporter substrate-binding protein [Thermodesulfobacteriota bacterium]|nr:ABC transporter substrate-binding protein [Thermodesulfobacteriota bacterium]